MQPLGRTAFGTTAWLAPGEAGCLLTWDGPGATVQLRRLVGQRSAWQIGRDLGTVSRPFDTLEQAQRFVDQLSYIAGVKERRAAAAAAEAGRRARARGER
jgi:hypothetical protein